MNTSYVIYEEATGRVHSQMVCPPSMIDLQIRPGQAWIEGSLSSGNAYVDVANQVIKPQADYSLAKLPLPCTVRIEGVEYKCTTQPIFEFDVPGEYRIEVDAGPRFLKKEFTYAYPPRSR